MSENIFANKNLKTCENENFWKSWNFYWKKNDKLEKRKHEFINMAY